MTALTVQGPQQGLARGADQWHACFRACDPMLRDQATTIYIYNILYILYIIIYQRFHSECVSVLGTKEGHGDGPQAHREQIVEDPQRLVERSLHLGCRSDFHIRWNMNVT